MAGSDSTAKVLAEALNNAARGANVLNNDNVEEVESLILEYFTSEPLEEETSEEEDGETCDEQQEEADSDSSEDDEALVNVQAPQVETDIQDGAAFNSHVDTMKVLNFTCKCKLKTACGRQSEKSNMSIDDGTISRSCCLSQFSVDEIVARRLNMAEFTEGEKDMIILGILAGLQVNCGDKTNGKPCRQKQRERPRTVYMVDSKIVCREAFKFLYGISQNKLTPLLAHYIKHGVTPRLKSTWGGRKYNTKALTPEDTERVVQFLTHFAEDHALVLPGRVPGHRKSDVRILPSSMTKATVWRLYRQLAIARNHRSVGKSAFFKLWKQHVPFIVVGRPMTDLCNQCKTNNERIRRTANLPEEEKMRILGEHMNHLRTVDNERKFYNKMVAESKAVAAASGITTLGRHAPNSFPNRFHYSFDFAQQVHLPSSPLQPGPIYFLVPRKCGIFGVCAEGIPQQVNYLIDEGMSSSKGSNMVISLFHNFLENYGIGEAMMDIHCDNCSGQNKNKYLLWYLAWRVMRGLHSEITVNFMPAGHTKFSPDWCFGLLKRKFKISEVHCLDDLCHVVQSSSLKGINRAQLVGTEAGDVRVPVFDWQAYFGGLFHPFKGIKSVYHFRFSVDAPGVVFFKKQLHDAEQQFILPFDIQTAQRRLTGLPSRISPPGLTPERQQYLRQHIRPFVRENFQDRLCP